MKDLFTKSWITENSVRICDRYEKGVLTLRGLHYQLVGLGMTNDIQHYHRVVQAMIDARWNGLVDFDQFSDLDRTMIGKTDFEETVLEDKVENAKKQIHLWMTLYSKNKWENQPYYPEVLIEKKALQGVFQDVCDAYDIALGACKGYPSLTFLYDAAQRFKNAMEQGKRCVILYFGDYDPSGEDIPRSIQENMRKFGVEVDVRRFALMKEQVIAWKLPPAPVKIKDARTANWDGLGQVELDAVEPNKLKQMCKHAIESVFDEELFHELEDERATERVEYQKQLKDFVNNIE